METIQSEASARGLQIGFYFGDAGADLRQLDPLVCDQVRLDVLPEPPHVEELEACDMPAPFDGGPRLIVEPPAAVTKETLVTRGPGEFEPFARRNDAWAQ